ncbi:hypothetical protein, partial [Klebsiella pneumoniae]|uniref:hypothetical protein n=1 Tax=Klebsiella pneumoniae TaxID=573 RepID=UPI001BE09813
RVQLRADQVRRVGRGRFTGALGGSNSPLCVEHGNDTAARGTVLLAFGFPQVFDLATALREHNPHLAVDDL